VIGLLVILSVFSCFTTTGKIQLSKVLRIVKQGLDDACGSVAIATILRSYYGLEVYENNILKAVERIGNDGTALFADLQYAVQTFGFKAIGILTSLTNTFTLHKQYYGA
jgi:predicted double-glycine peptidase